MFQSLNNGRQANPERQRVMRGIYNQTHTAVRPPKGSARIVLNPFQNGPFTGTNGYTTHQLKHGKEPETWSADEFDSKPITAGSPNEAISEDASAVSIGIHYEFGSGYSACALGPHIRIHMGSNEALYSKSGKGRYTGESNQEQMMCIRVYIVRWSEQKSSILIVSRRNTNVTCDFLNSCCMGKYNVWTF